MVFLSNYLDNIKNSDFVSQFINTRLSKAVRFEDKDGKRFYTVEVTGFSKEDVTVQYNDQTRLVRVTASHESADEEHTSSRKISREFTVVAKPHDVIVKNGELKFTVNLPAEPEKPDDFENLDVE